jgi:uncharacterized Zn finger protein
VRDIAVKGSTITAKVQGSRPSPYKIKIDIPQFTPDQQQAILDGIVENTLVLSQLLNREIPRELNQMALDKKIRIFPSSWKDFGMDCSCPDWAVPCKHLAAVVYLIANEIDSNPFILFNLRGLDLIASLQKHHAGIGAHAEEKIPAVEYFIVEEMPQAGNAPEFTAAFLPDFSLIPDQTDKIFTLLPAKPLFYDKDFRPLLQSAYRQVKNSVKNQSPGKLKPGLDSIARRIDSFDDTMILLDQTLKVEDICLTRKDKKKDYQERIPWEDFINLLENLDPAVLENCNDALRGIELHRQFARALASGGAFIPQLLTNRDGHYLVRYIPAENDTQVKSLCLTMQDYAIPGTVWIWHKPKKGEELYVAVNPVENSRLILSSFIQSMFKEIGADSKFSGDGRDPALNLFFLDRPHKFDGLTEKQIPNTIQLWLKRLSRPSRQWQPVLMIEERFGMTQLFLHGGTTRKNRDEFVDEFQNKRNRWIFILSLKAGGTGLNLTAASHVIHYDFWWNPAAELQAINRAYRIGQHKNVMVNRMLTQGTFEEKIDEMLQNKKELANLTVASGENWIGDLSDKELKEIFQLRKLDPRLIRTGHYSSSYSIGSDSLRSTTID